jgi:hypothetical protein
MIRRLLAALLVVLVAAPGLLGSAGCAAIARRHPSAGVPIDRRPTPPPPDTSAVTAIPAEPAPSAATPPPAPDVKPTPPAQVPPVETAMSPEERHAALERIAADTTAAGSAVRKCAGKSLLPDQESVFDTTRSLLAQIRSALVRDELWRAESLARKARQLALSLECR